MSYAWGDDSPEGKAHTQFIDDLCAQAKARGRIVLRDKDELNVGDSIAAFMRRIGSGDRIFVIISARYLSSPNCMFELSEIWRTSRLEGRTFLDRVRVYVTPDVSLWAAKDRAKWAIHWKAEYEELNAIARTHGPTALGEDGNAQLRLMQSYYLNVADILATMNSILRPRNLEELLEYGFGDPGA